MCMWLLTTYPNIMQHFTACHIQFSECRRCTGCLLRTFPSHYSICKQHVIPDFQHLHVVFSCFVFFVMIPLIGNTVVRVLVYSVDRKPLQFPLIIHYLYMSCGASTKTIYGFWIFWSMGFKLLENHNFISFSNAPTFIYKRCRTRGSL